MYNIDITNEFFTNDYSQVIEEIEGITIKKLKIIK